MEGVPPAPDRSQLELVVRFNACVFSVAQAQTERAQALLTEGLHRVLTPSALGVAGGTCGGTTGDPSSEAPSLWGPALRAVADGPLAVGTLRLLCLQWAVWLSSNRLTHIQELRGELSSLSDRLSALEEEEERKRSLSASDHEPPRLVADPLRLTELLDVCTVVARGAEWLSDGRPSDALSELQRAFSLPAPRDVLAQAHVLSGRCLADTGRPQMALLCFMRAMETEPHCVSALYHSTEVYRQLGNVTALVEGLRLLNTALRLPPPAAPSMTAEVSPLSAPLLLGSPALGSLLSAPPAPSVQRRLALSCVLHGRVAEGVELYLDLLADLQSDPQHAVPPGSVQAPPPVQASPRGAELYLEAAAALLLAGRGPDCWALCDEVLSATLDLLPQRLTLGDPSEDQDRDQDRDQDPLDVVLWAGSAHLLQAHCQAALEDWKQAVTCYTRCINLTGKVCFKTHGPPPPPPSGDLSGRPGAGLRSLQTLKGLSLAGRGVCFTQRDQLREALGDLQLSALVSPGGVGAGLWLGEVLWRLDRRREAASCWERSLAAESPAETLPLYLQEPRSSPSLDPRVLRSRVQSLTQT
ncbi:Fanconi anemia group G protein isoform X2 [Gadus macrocephalus]|uniref:Fanconi anemia group G protein isoform X2 n=1 Tax=Gadus macrocephalus TaxID=80720 RepID=UPI0028CB4477|nr:Fanconi anemia group G protein isoform X2 [Gadus macrocephalus]